MFTGIVEELGSAVEVGPRLTVATRKVGRDSEPGASVAVNGVCLTVVERAADGETCLLGFDVSDETARRTSLGALTPGDPINLERPVTLMQRLGGHLVQGHVDGVGRVTRTRPAEVGIEMTFEAPTELSRYLVEKGSVAVEGVSLTVAEIEGSLFGVALIPYTLEATNLGGKQPGDPVNLEVDVIAKHVERLMKETS